jgi:hypothetical protein
MPDDTDAPSPAARDDVLARALAVDPLDDVTRRRLVTTAIRSTGTARRARMLVAAAAVVLVAVVSAGAVVAIRGNGSDQVEAQRREALGALPRPAADAASGAASVGPATPTAAPAELGDFGELTVAANRQRLFTAIGTTKGTASADASSSVGGESAARKLANLDCTVRGLPSGTTVALATGTVDATRVIVVVTDTTGGNRIVSTVDTGTCRIRPLS